MNPPKIISFPNLGALVNDALRPSEMRMDDRRSHDDTAHYVRFNAGVTWPDARRMALNGDLETARALSPAILQNANAMMTSAPRLDPVYKLDEGRWIDVARYVKGEPECWGDMVETGEVMPRRGVSIILNTGVPGNISARSVNQVGVEIGGAVLGLQALGYSVTLHFAKNWTADNRHDGLLFHAPVNPGGAPLDTSLLAAIGQAWFHRRIMFSMLETMDEETRRLFSVGHGYGYSQPLDKITARNIVGGKPVVINVLDHLRNPKGVTTLIKGALC